MSKLLWTSVTIVSNSRLSKFLFCHSFDPSKNIRWAISRSFLKKLAIPGLFFLIFVFTIQLTGKNVQYKNDWIRTEDLWCRKRPLYQLSHNHYHLHHYSGKLLWQRTSRTFEMLLLGVVYLLIFPFQEYSLFFLKKWANLGLFFCLFSSVQHVTI